MKTIFDKQQEYSEQVSEKVDELKKLCHILKIPMFITLCLANSEKETVYEKEMVSAATCGYNLKDDQIVKHVNVSLGFDTIQPTSESTLDMDDVAINYIETDDENDSEV